MADKVKLTKRSVDAAVKGAAGRSAWLTTDVPGLYLTTRANGAASYVLKYLKRGKLKTFTIGVYGEITAEDAKTKALAAKVAIKSGADPAAEKVERRNAATMKEAVAEWLGIADPMEPGARPPATERRRASTLYNYASVMRCHVLPHVGDLAVAEVEAADIQKLVDRLKDRPAQQGAMLRMLSALFGWCRKRKHCPKGFNPAAVDEVERPKEKARKRFLAADEQSRLLTALDASDFDPYAAAAFKVYLLTGMRHREVLRLRWTDFNVEARTFEVRDGKTGDRIVHLNDEALAVIAALSKSGDYIIRGASADKPRVSLAKPWRKVCEAAKIENCHIHDLRHSFAAMAVRAGISLYVTGGLLGHKSSAHTQRYAHIADDVQRTAAAAVGKAFAR